VPLCGDGAIARADVKTNRLATTVKIAVADGDGRIATGVGSVWAITDRKGVLSRIDPDTNMSVAEIYIAGGAFAVVFSDDALWVTSEDSNLKAGRLTRVNPHNNEIIEVVEVGPKPGRLSVGEGGVWTLNRGNGTVTRIDPATNKVVATIAVGEDAARGEVTAAFGSVWISAPGVPIVRIDPRTNRAVQRFTGEGGGAILAAHGSLWLAAGPGLTWRLDPALVAAMRP
jgi:YVTN family beta-propeller protein